MLISGHGSNLRALIDACAEPGFPAEIVVVLSNVRAATGLERGRKGGIPTAVIDHRDYPDRESFDAAMDACLREAGAEFVCLAGFMRLLSPSFVQRWEGRIVNIHPSLLPAFKGLHVHEQVLAAGVPMSGCTVHYVIAELDAGPTILQGEVPVREGDTPHTLAGRVMEREHRIYPQALKLAAEGKVRLENGRAVFGEGAPP